MRKILTFLLCCLLTFSLTACAGESDRSAAGDTAETVAVTETGPTADSGVITKQALFDKYGLPFRVRRAFDMRLIRLFFYEDTATRECLDSMKDGTEKFTALSWDVVDGDLVVTGAWNERLTLDQDADAAISQTDGETYQICKAD